MTELDGTKAIRGQNCQAGEGTPTSGKVEEATLIQPRDNDLAYICNGTVFVHQNIINGRLWTSRPIVAASPGSEIRIRAYRSGLVRRCEHRPIETPPAGTDSGYTLGSAAL
ncbi:hypothetical protein [Nocardia aobensis]|uniref:hypothetical protein n=1 Tax=Nocardia aobensis TaxID=257277 RepID=UPI0005687BE8|nr:hypothetical protein [Nocardia aobensis]